jgi:hypothetical protein
VLTDVLFSHTVTYGRTMLKLHIIGDSNVDRYLSIVKAAKEDPAIQETTFTRATNLVQLQEALVPATPSEPHPNLVLACLTNPITNHPFEDYNVLITHCNRTFAQVLAWIQEGRGAVPGTMRQVLKVLQVFEAYILSFTNVPKVLSCTIKHVSLVFTC